MARRGASAPSTKSTAPLPAVYLRKAALTLKIKNLSQLSPVRRTTSSLLVPTNIAELAAYPDISPQSIQASTSPSQAIHEAVNATSTLIQNMGVNYRCAEIPMAQELFNGPDVVTVLEEMGCKRLANGLYGRDPPETARPFGASRAPKGRHTHSAPPTPRSSSRLGSRVFAFSMAFTSVDRLGSPLSLAG